MLTRSNNNMYPAFGHVASCWCHSKPSPNPSLFSFIRNQVAHSNDLLEFRIASSVPRSAMIQRFCHSHPMWKNRSKKSNKSWIKQCASYTIPTQLVRENLPIRITGTKKNGRPRIPCPRGNSAAMAHDGVGQWPGRRPKRTLPDQTRHGELLRGNLQIELQLM